MTEDDKTTKEFLDEYGKLRTKYKRDFVAIPQYFQNTTGSWELRIVPHITESRSNLGA